MLYAIIESGGKQYRVSEGSRVRLEKLEDDAGSEVTFDRVLAFKDGEKTRFGNPYLEDVKVSGRVLNHGKGEKIIVYKYKPKKNYRRKKGHRQPFTEVLIEKVEMS